MASDKDRSGTPADLGALPSLLPGRTGLADGNAPSSASFVAHSDSNDFTPFTDHLQHQFNQHDWAFTDAQMGHWSPGIDTLDSQFFATADAAALAFPMPTAPVAAVPGSVPLSLSAGFGAPDVSQEWADITTGFNAPNESITQGSSESPVDAMEGTDATDQRSKIPPKIGTRFSKESLRILRNWLSTHSRRPFPTDEERRLLQNQTGLTKTQILNWLANARRRGKVPEYQSSSPHVRSNAASPIPIPPRAATPAPQAAGTSHFDPLQRWVDSPPEHEPATAAAIARAVASSPPAVDGRPRDDSAGESESGSSRYRPSPSSSVGTSQSSGGSAYSFESRDSAGTMYKANRHRSLRRKRRTAGRRRKGEKTPLSAPMGTFQCTFCTETFSTKHTWQRHEKSLHLALERWVCAPEGPRYLSANGISHCVFCGQDDPNDAHIEGHNFTICQQRDLDDRTFHRKDHLGQHLRLVHNATQADLERPLKEWKMDMPRIKSLCGFCGISMDTWQARTDHLADHFKLGSTMADWQGDWGFEASILARLESAIAPYMIEAERVSPFPFAASNNPIESPRHAYELIKLELSNFLEQRYDRSGKFPEANDLHVEACCIVFTAEIHGFGEFRPPSPSWLRDLIMSAGDIVERAKLSPLRFNAENRVTPLKIIGKSDLFEHCPLEVQLLQFVAENFGRSITDADLQQRAATLIQELEAESVMPSEMITTWFIKLVGSSSAWLANFRQRAQIPYGAVIAEPPGQDTNSSKIDGIIQSYNILDERLLEHMEMLQTHGIQPNDENLRQQGLVIIAQVDNPEWKTIAFQNHSWLTRFKRRHLPWSNIYDIPSMAEKSSSSSRRVSRGPLTADNPLGDQQQHMQQWSEGGGGGSGSGGGGSHTPSSQPPTFSRKKGLIFFNDPNFDRWVGRQLARWVAATTSEHNPNRHIPTDDELQHQARWIGYEDGDPWNLTPADNAEWLRRFKRDVGLLNDSGPGLFGSHPLDDVRDDRNV